MLQTPIVSFPSNSILRLLVGAGLLFPIAASALQVNVESVVAPDFVANQLSAVWRGGLQDARIGKLSVPALSQNFRSLHWSCAESDPWPFRCSGPVRLQGKQRGRLALTLEPSLQVNFRDAKASLDWLETPAGGQLNLTDAPMDWFFPVVQASWPELSTLSGELSADLMIADDVQGRWRINELAFDQRDGTIAGAGLSVQGQLRWRELNGAERVALTAETGKGEILLGPVYRAIGQTAIKLDADLALMHDDSLRVEQFHFSEGEDLALRGSATIDADGIITDLSVASAMARFPGAQPYLQSVLSNAGFNDVAMSGQLRGSANWRKEELIELAGHVDDLSMQDSTGRLSWRSLSGELAYGPAAPPSRLSWQELSVFGVPVSATELRWHWRPEQLALAQPLLLKTLGGEIEIASFRRDQRIWRGAVRVRELAFSELAEHLGWPAFAGTLSGEFPELRYADNTLSFPGDLNLRAFDGRIRLSDLKGERLFSAAPSLAVDIKLDDLDLDQLTSAMSFGRIEGRLDGYITGLRLLNWAPVAFDARFQTDAKTAKRQRISQRAVQGLSSVGGARMDNRLMSFVDSFSYAALGLACRLQENVCAMDGLDSVGNGYTIVRGSGLPRLNVIGFQRKVNWPVLVARMRSAATGSGPVIE